MLTLIFVSGTLKQPQNGEADMSLIGGAWYEETVETVSMRFLRGGEERLDKAW